MDDLISKQSVLDALRTCYDTETITMDNGDEYINYGDAVGEIEQLSSAQPEIIRCKDCKSYQLNHHYCSFHRSEFCVDDYCSYAERKEVTT